MQFGWDDEGRKPIKISVKRDVYKRAKGKCECCGIILNMSHGDFHHTRTPKISPTAKTVQFLCPTCHRKYGHKRKVVNRDYGFFSEKEHTIKRRRAPTKTKASSKTIKRKSTTTKKKIPAKKKTTTSKKTTSKTTLKRRRVPAERDIFGNVIRYKYVKVKPKKTSKKTTTKKKTTRRKRKEDDLWSW
jgi:hypothetical protein